MLPAAEREIVRRPARAPDSLPITLDSSQPNGEAFLTNPVLARNRVTVTGRGTQPMLFAHGFGCDQNMWRFVAPAFEDRYQTVLFDFVGAGGSDWSAYDARRYGSLS